MKLSELKVVFAGLPLKIRVAKTEILVRIKAKLAELSSHRVKLLVIAGLVVLGGVGGIVYYLLPREKASIFEVTGSHLSGLVVVPAPLVPPISYASIMAANTGVAPIGSIVSANLYIVDSTPAIDSIEVQLAYTNCATPEVSPGAFWGEEPRTVAEPQIGDGLVSFAYGIKEEMGYSQGTGPVATITTGPISSEPCRIDILGATLTNMSMNVPGNTPISSQVGGIIYAEGYAPSPSPTPTPSPSLNGVGPVQLSLSPSDSAVPAGTTMDLNINADTGLAFGAAWIQAILYYSDTCITPVVTRGYFFYNTMVEPQVGDGRITFTYGSETVGDSIGQGVLATITTGPTTGPCEVTFGGVWVASSGFPGNHLGGVSNAVINIGEGQPSPSVEASMEPEPEAQLSYAPPLPSVAPSLAPSVAPSWSPSPSPSVTPSPSTTASVVPSPSVQAGVTQSPSVIPSPSASATSRVANIVESVRTVFRSRVASPSPSVQEESVIPYPSPETQVIVNLVEVPRFPNYCSDSGVINWLLRLLFPSACE